MATIIPAQDKAKIARLLVGSDSSLCYGVGCGKRGRCARYLAIDAVTDRDSAWQSYFSSCHTAQGFPLFFPMTKQDNK